MRLLHKLARLSPSEQHSLVRATLLLLSIRLALWLLPFRTVLAILFGVRNRTAVCVRERQALTDQVTWSVSVVSRYVPAATCLTQALSAQILLQRRGVPSRLHIGVARDENERVIAHAWVESGGKVVIGGSGVARYTPLLVLERGKL